MYIIMLYYIHIHGSRPEGYRSQVFNLRLGVSGFGVYLVSWVVRLAKNCGTEELVLVVNSMFPRVNVEDLHSE